MITYESIRHLTHLIVKLLLQLLENFLQLGINLRSPPIHPQKLYGALKLNNTQSLHQGIQKLYTLHNPSTFGVEALTIMNQLVPSDIPTFHVTYVQTRQTSDIHLPDFPGFTPEIERVRLQHFDEHPIIHHMPQTLNGAYKISDFISQKNSIVLRAFTSSFYDLLRLCCTNILRAPFILMSPRDEGFQALQT